MIDYATLSARLEQSLALSAPPVAITLRDQKLPNVIEPTKSVPAGCSFWEIGGSETVSTTAEHHKFCSIGIHTHNLANAPKSQPEELNAALGAMKGLDYIRPDELASLPVMAHSSKYVVYGPLREATESPSLVLLFASASQGLVICEALSRIDGEMPIAMGRPACAVVPQVLSSSRSASSLGCCGARAYLNVLDDGVGLWGLHGDNLSAYVDEIEVLAKANTTLRQFHEGRRAAIESGGSPTVEQSLAELQG